MASFQRYKQNSAYTVYLCLTLLNLTMKYCIYKSKQPWRPSFGFDQEGQLFKRGQKFGPAGRNVMDWFGFWVNEE
jgi:hypothetical protein